jgi:formate dehydrogenase beta subunit
MVHLQQELHKIQHRWGFLPAEELRALSRRTEVPLHRIHEVASSFPGYRLAAPAPVDVKVCRDMSCHLRGVSRLESGLRELAAELGGTGPEGGPRVVVGGVSCLGQCDKAPALVIGYGHEGHYGDYVYRGLSEGEYAALVRRAADNQPLEEQPATRARPLDWKIDPYPGEVPGYAAVRKLVETRDVEWVLGALQAANLRGMGGARFPTFQKWRSVRNEPGREKYVVCNADECEPGTFKDRDLMRRVPHLLVEGMILAGLCINATHGYIYIRHEYEEEIEAMREAIEEARSRGFCGQNILGTELSYPLEVFVSPGGYICGEESALIEAMEDRRAEPRNKPPFPFQNGLYGKPTIINNVESLMWTPSIALNGGEWYKNQGVNGGDGLWFCSISGDVNWPGVYEVPFGLTVGELIDKHAGGMRDGQQLKAIAPSGPSSGYLPAVLREEDLPTAAAKKYFRERLSPDGRPLPIRELPLDYKVLGGIGNMLGAAFVAVGDRACIVDMAANTTQFFRNESCGKCVPCRMGSEKLVEVLAEVTGLRLGPEKRAAYFGSANGAAPRPDGPGLVPEVAQALEIASICGLGMVVPNAIRTVMQYFRDELDEHIRNGRCPAGVCGPR